MAKNKKEGNNIPEGMKCYQKQGGGSLRFTNRIIKSMQKFWVYPEAIPEGFKTACKEVPDDFGAVVINTVTPAKQSKKELGIVPEKFEMVKALDEKGNIIKKGNSNLFNVMGEDAKPLNPKPLRKGKATELLETLNS